MRQSHTLLAPIVRTLPFPDQPVERLHRFFHGRIEVVPVGIVDIDIIGLETGKAFLAFPLDFVGGETAVASGIIESQFGGNLNLVADAALLHPLADRRFAFASGAAFNPARIEIGCVKKRAPPVVEQVEQDKGRFAIDAAADQVRAIGQRRHFHVAMAEFPGFHGDGTGIAICEKRMVSIARRAE